MNIHLIIIASVLIGLYRQSFAQEELLGKSMKDAAAYAKTIKPNFNFADTLEYHSGEQYPRDIILLGFHRWNNPSDLQILIDSFGIVAEISVGSKPPTIMSQQDRESAIDELTKKFGRPNHAIEKDRATWEWNDRLGTYYFWWNKIPMNTWDYSVLKKK